MQLGVPSPERIDDDLVSIALEALYRQALDVHRVLVLLPAMQVLFGDIVAKQRRV